MAVCLIEGNGIEGAFVRAFSFIPALFFKLYQPGWLCTNIQAE
jgi:hypothetical protein